MNVLYVYIVIFLVFLGTFFIDTKSPFVAGKIPIGVIYSATSSSSSIVSNVSERTIFRDDAGADLPTYDIFSVVALPHRFIARLSDKETAAYVLMPAAGQGANPGAKAMTRRFKTPPAGVSKAGKVQAGQPEVNPLKVVKIENDVVYNFNYFYGLVKGSNKNYFFSGCNKAIGDVTVTVYSLTPWNNKHIILFKVTNNQSQYFFTANISIYQNEELTLGDFYNEPLVSPGKTQDFIAVIPKSINTYFILKLTESGGSNRVFNVPFTSPK